MRIGCAKAHLQLDGSKAQNFPWDPVVNLVLLERHMVNSMIMRSRRFCNWVNVGSLRRLPERTCPDRISAISTTRHQGIGTTLQKAGVGERSRRYFASDRIGLWRSQWR